MTEPDLFQSDADLYVTKVFLLVWFGDDDEPYSETLVGSDGNNNVFKLKRESKEIGDWIGQYGLKFHRVHADEMGEGFVYVPGDIDVATLTQMIKMRFYGGLTAAVLTQS